MTQPPYGSDPGQPSYPSYSSGGQPYQNPPAPGAYPPAPGAYPPAPNPYMAPPVYPATQEAKSSLLGIIGLGVVVVAAIAFWAATYSVLKAVFSLIDMKNPSNMYNLDPNTFAQVASGPAQIMMLTSVIGLGGWIVSIVATATKRGRAFGIIGIVLGVLAPLGYFVIAGVLGAQMLS